MRRSLLLVILRQTRLLRYVLVYETIRCGKKYVEVLEVAGTLPYVFKVGVGDMVRVQVDVFAIGFLARE